MAKSEAGGAGLKFGGGYCCRFFFLSFPSDCDLYSFQTSSKNSRIVAIAASTKSVCIVNSIIGDTSFLIRWTKNRHRPQTNSAGAGVHSTAKIFVSFFFLFQKNWAPFFIFCNFFKLHFFVSCPQKFRCVFVFARKKFGGLFVFCKLFFSAQNKNCACADAISFANLQACFSIRNNKSCCVFWRVAPKNHSPSSLKFSWNLSAVSCLQDVGSVFTS